MTLDQRIDFHRALAHVSENKDLADHDRSLLRELRQAIYDMCRCWPCSTHESYPAVYLDCEFCKVCAQHAHSLYVFAGKR